jgi:hypothetical protein
MQRLALAGGPAQLLRIIGDYGFSGLLDFVVRVAIFLANRPFDLATFKGEADVDLTAVLVDLELGKVRHWGALLM